MDHPECHCLRLRAAAIMMIELVAGRIIAKHLGASVYTWTSVIGIVLAGIAIGNYIGGPIADKHSNKKTLALLLRARLRHVRGDHPARPLRR
ncbi:MAG: fused MFS/spermidine synthase [Planctomycetes bacterium]|nr:fused MFS/spermidine synthase [Planctomycetota bacterium]